MSVLLIERILGVIKIRMKISTYVVFFIKESILQSHMQQNIVVKTFITRKRSFYMSLKLNVNIVDNINGCGGGG